jgi:hypothetical protein
MTIRLVYRDRHIITSSPTTVLVAAEEPTRHTIRYHGNYYDIPCPWTYYLMKIARPNNLTTCFNMFNMGWSPVQITRPSMPIYMASLPNAYMFRPCMYPPQFSNKTPDLTIFSKYYNLWWHGGNNVDGWHLNSWTHEMAPAGHPHSLAEVMKKWQTLSLDGFMKRWTAAIARDYPRYNTIDELVDHYWFAGVKHPLNPTLWHPRAGQVSYFMKKEVDGDTHINKARNNVGAGSIRTARVVDRDNPR